MVASTYKDIRRLTGLSLATISKYFNGGTVTYANRALIDAAVRDLDYQINTVASGLRSRRSKTLGVIIPDLASTFFTTVVSLMEGRLRDAGYAVIVCDARGTSEGEADALRFLLSKQVDGLIIAPISDHPEGLAEAVARGLPVVAVDRAVGDVAVDTVVIDNRAAVGASVRLLVEAGHRDVALLAGPDSMWTMRERRAGFRGAVKAATGRFPRASLVAPHDVTIEGGYKGMRRVLALATPPTAVVCANYEFTLGATIALNDLAPAVPRPALVGFDNQELARVLRPHPPLVAQPLNAMAAQAADLLVSRIDSGADREPRTVVLDADLLVGDPSTYVLPSVALKRVDLTPQGWAPQEHSLGGGLVP